MYIVYIVYIVVYSEDDDGVVERRAKEMRAKKITDEGMKEELRMIGEELKRWRMERERESKREKEKKKCEVIRRKTEKKARVDKEE